jgi:hypothetical protein
MLGQKKHNSVLTELLSFRCVGMNYHPFGYRGRTGAVKTFPPLNLHHAELAALIPKLGLFVLQAFAATVDGLGWF